MQLAVVYLTGKNDSALMPGWALIEVKTKIQVFPSNPEVENIYGVVTNLLLQNQKIAEGDIFIILNVFPNVIEGEVPNG